MIKLTKSDCHAIHGGDGRFTVLVYADVPLECAKMVADLYEQVLIRKLTTQEFYHTLIKSPYDRKMLEKAIKGIEVLHWP